MLAEIVDIHTGSNETYGPPWVHAMLCRRGVSFGHRRIERLMGTGLHGQSPIMRPPGSRARVVSSVSVDPAVHRVVGVGAGRSVLGRCPVAQR
ncbi:IS3 family transposase [Nocardia beijingensis]|uniref:IS3 family transposase n=1 Tax=Nocardia beijingensis TaxID=95162 RepID=UPI0033E3A865